MNTAYTLTHPNLSVQPLRDAAKAHGYLVHGSGGSGDSSTLTLRFTSEEEAISGFEKVMASAGLTEAGAVIETGHGVHRRVVAQG